MMRAHFKNRLVEEKRAMKEVIEQDRADKSEFRRLKEKKDAQDVEMDSFRTSYSKGSWGLRPMPWKRLSNGWPMPSAVSTF